MRFKLLLHTSKGSLLPFNYQYPLSAAIYKIIQRADREFALFLHDARAIVSNAKNCTSGYCSWHIVRNALERFY
jgi:CRISPR/Cas system endoribonuclease Cas6 (RAMP superfamily)